MQVQRPHTGSIRQESYMPKTLEQRSKRNFQYTENDAQQPQMLMLEARDICGSATGRNGRVFLQSLIAA
jgi:hypothetical protein